ncbi:MAG: protein-glutamate O-methyltransferase CheR [Eubacterium sp.]|nr:protein-glutamate O-methyltransferase CheR [Eubacterium sp.]MCM1217386.1 protein-glutamate O-methyltransferase CheR [Lachnospiraceae bacterium]MCM1304819.1 protein-glutamate O-methyltransferase CheR [Butyrivibrio sp.]MCM1345059.1 protein-glutamate O-methyltransferase CheR [Muribaculaceae bacterium]MCM1238581.1 protein-glutamate O-methyltransferase CheR [Lachnospiraceae bacterium]
MAYDYEYFKREILALTTIDLDCYKEKQMKRRIDTLITKHKIEGYDKYVARLKTDKELFDEFVSYITINVSEFYRNPEQWKLIEADVFPELIRKFGKNLKIWSAACSTGDEPYSLVMALSRHVPLSNIKIYATDLDKQIIAKAKVGVYNEKSIASVPEDFKKKYFTKVGPSYKIADEIKERVEFHEHNLLKDAYPKDYNLIVCRNVLIYFTEEAKEEVFRKFNKSLAPGGVLFIGSTEQIVNYKEIGYERKNSFFYERP